MNHKRPPLSRLLLSGLALFMAAMPAACSSMTRTPPPLPCPAAGLVLRADNIAFSKDTAQPLSPANVAVTGVIGNYRGGCSKTRKGELEYVIEFDIMASKADAKDPLSFIELPYFIAVLGPDDSIMQKQAFVTKLAFEGKQSAKTKDLHKIPLSLPETADVTRYKIAAGFILTPGQHAYNQEAAANLRKVR